MTEKLNFYDIVRLAKGTLALEMPSYDMTAPVRTVIIPHNVDKVRVPRTFALGIFTDATLEKMYKSGDFKIEPEKQFEQEVAEIFFPIEGKAVIADEKEIVTMLRQGNRIGIKKLLEENSANRDNVIILAREHIGEISLSMIDFLNDFLQVELQIDNVSGME